MEVTIQLQGFAELAAALKTLPDNIARNALRSAVAAGAAEVRVAAKANALAMRDTGTLARSIYQKQIRELSSLQRQTFYVGVRSGRKLKKYGKSKLSVASEEGAFYGRLVEFGHWSRPAGKHQLRDRGGRAGSGRWVFNRLSQAKDRSTTIERMAAAGQIHWIPPHPFLRPAFDAKKGAAIEAMAKKIRARLERFKVQGK